MKTQKHLILFIVSLALISLACSIDVGGPEYPAQPVPSSPADAQTLRDMIQQAMVTGAETGVITLQITESQLTAFVAEKIALQTDHIACRQQTTEAHADTSRLFGAAAEKLQHVGIKDGHRGGIIPPT